MSRADDPPAPPRPVTVDIPVPVGIGVWVGLSIPARGLTPAEFERFRRFVDYLGTAVVAEPQGDRIAAGSL